MNKIMLDGFSDLIKFTIPLKFFFTRLNKGKNIEMEFFKDIKWPKFIDYIFLSMDLEFFYYLLSYQIKVRGARKALIKRADKLHGLNDLTIEVAKELITAKLMKEIDLKESISLHEKAYKKGSKFIPTIKTLIKFFNSISMYDKVEEYESKLNSLSRISQTSKFHDQDFQHLLSQYYQQMDSLRKKGMKIKKKYKNLFSIQDGFLDILIKLNECIQNYEETKKNYKKSTILYFIQESLDILKFISIISGIIYYHLCHKFNIEPIRKHLLLNLIHCLGYAPEPLPLEQSYCYLSLENRKKSFLSTFSSDSNAPFKIKSLREIIYLPKDGDFKNPKPSNYEWVLKTDSLDAISPSMSEKTSTRVKSLNGKEKDHSGPILAHIKSHFGEIKTVYHSPSNFTVPIDVYVVPPSKKRNYSLLITHGLSRKPMNAPKDAWKIWDIDFSILPKKKLEFVSCKYAELVILLPPDWPLPNIFEKMESIERAWPIMELHSVINYVYDNNQWIWNGHTMGGFDDQFEPFAKNTKLGGWYFTFPLRLPESFYMWKVNDKKLVVFLQMIPLYNEEIKFAIKYGSDGLRDRFSRYGISDIVDLDRINTCL
ncbi:MAG: suppressor of fused domain protein [Promethearchaeota archaeon]